MNLKEAKKLKIGDVVLIKTDNYAGYPILPNLHKMHKGTVLSLEQKGNDIYARISGDNRLHRHHTELLLYKQYALYFSKL